MVWAMEQEEESNVTGIPVDFVEEVLTLAKCDTDGFQSLAAVTHLELVTEEDPMQENEGRPYD